METCIDDMAPRFKQLLERREAELRQVLRAGHGVDREDLCQAGHENHAPLPGRV